MKTSKHLRETNRDYAIYTAQNRAIPRIADGLKHGQRLGLWLMRNQAGKVKTAALTGEYLKSLCYDHGDASASQTICALAAPYGNNVPFLNHYGNFGTKLYPTAYGAPRYTSVGRSKYAEEILYRDMNLIPMLENYDGSNTYPEYFLSIIPVILLNSVSGIAVGFSTDILPRSLSGLIRATVDALSDKKKLSGLDIYYHNYDIDIKQIEKNKYELTGKLKIIDSSTVHIRELPPGLNIKNLIKRLIVMEEGDRIVDFTDNSSSCVDITVKFKRGSIKDWTEEQAIEFFKLRERITERIVCIDWNGRSVRTIDDPETLVREFVEWRLGWYTRRYEKLKSDAEFEIQYWQILERLFRSSFTKKLGSFKNKAEMQTSIETLVKMNVPDTHMQRVLNIPIYRWTDEFKTEIGEKIASMEADIVEYSSILESPTRLKQIYMDELNKLKSLKV